MIVAVLDDDELRRDRMVAIVSEIVPRATVHSFDSAPDMIQWLENQRPAVTLYSLDHDLGPNRIRDGASFDPGTGRDVVEHLLQTAEPRPVIVHTSNSPAATGMMTALELGGWPAYRVVPRAETEWLEDAWLPCVRQVLSESGAQQEC